MIKSSITGVNAVQDEIMKEIEKLTKGNKFVLVGYPEGGGTEPDGTPIAMVAAANQFGTDTIPERPFLTNGIRKGEPEINQIATDGVNEIIEGKSDMDKVLNQIGLVAVGAIQKEIRDLKTPPNAESTIKAKGSSNPLIDTGNMRQATTYILSKNKPEEGIG